VPQVHFSLKFEEKMSMFDALGLVLLDAQEYHRKGFPLANPIQRCVLFFQHYGSGNGNNFFIETMFPSMHMKVFLSIAAYLIVC
jgi:hypothetical protein